MKSHYMSRRLIIRNTPIEAYSIIFNNAVTHSSSAIQFQTFTMPPNTIFVKNQLISCVIVNNQALTSNIKKAYLMVNIKICNLSIYE